MANNDLIFNAALAGAAAGAKAGRWVTSTVPASYLSDRNAALAFAAALDNLIPLDAAMNTSKAALIQSLCLAVLQSKAFTAADVTSTLPQAVVALYNELEAVLEPVSGGGGGDPLNASFWVDPGVASTGNGSATSPFLTIAEATAALAALKATEDIQGIVFLAAGDYGAEAVSWAALNDADLNRNSIVFCSWGGAATNIGDVSLTGAVGGLMSVTFIQVAIANLTMVAESCSITFDGAVCGGTLTGNIDTSLNVRNNSNLNLVSTFGSVSGSNSFIDTLDGCSAQLFGCIGAAITNGVDTLMRSCPSTSGGSWTSLEGGTFDLDDCRIADLSATGAATIRDCHFQGVINTLEVFGGATFDNCVIDNPNVDSGGADLTLNNCRFSNPTDVSAENLTVRNTFPTGFYSAGDTLTIDKSSYEAGLKGGFTITAVVGIEISDVLDGLESIGYTAAAPLVLTLMPAGHLPGMYSLGWDITVRTAAGAGSLTRTFSYSIPTSGAVTTSTVGNQLPATGLGRPTPSGTNPSAYCNVMVRSDGVNAITMTITPAGIAGAPVMDVYGCAALMAAAA